VRSTLLAHFCAASWLPVVEELHQSTGPERFTGSSHSGCTAKDREKFPTWLPVVKSVLHASPFSQSQLKDDLDATNSTAHGIKG
jgi:hypothetical protein